VVVALGGTALRSLRNDGDANVTRARGRRLPVPGLPDDVSCFVTYHPAAVLHGATHLAQRIVSDLAVARESRAMVHPPPNGAPTGRTLAVDTEWDVQGRLLNLAFANDKAIEVYDAPITSAPAIPEGVRYLVGHSLAGEIEQMVGNRVPVGAAPLDLWAQGKRVFDSLLLARMADENGGPGAYELETLLLSTLPVAPWKAATDAVFKKTGDMGTVDPELRRVRCGTDAWASFLLAKHFVQKLLPAQQALVTFTHQLAATISRISLAGAVVDMSHLGELGRVFRADVAESSDRLIKLALSVGMTEFSPTKDTDIRVLLFGKLGLPVLSKTKKERLASVDRDTLGQIDHEAARLLLDFGRAQKLLSTNIDGLTPLITIVGPLLGWLPFNINPLAARTGRRSSSRPNSQNWTAQVKSLVRSRWPTGQILEADYSKLEPLILAWLAKDDTLRHAFTDGGGYIFFAKKLWGFGCEEGTPEYRATKSIILGVHYNMQTPKMAKELWVLGVRFSADYEAHEKETDRLRRKYLLLVPGVVRYMARQEEELLRSGQVVSADGAIRRLPLVDGTRTPGYGHLLNQAINFPVQRLASSVSGAALIDVERQLLAEAGLTYVQYIEMLWDARRKLLTTGLDNGIMYPQSVIINEVHDSIVLDLFPDHVARDTELVVETMKAVPTLRSLVPSFDVPLALGLTTNSHWGKT